MARSHERVVGRTSSAGGLPRVRTPVHLDRHAGDLGGSGSQVLQYALARVDPGRTPAWGGCVHQRIRSRSGPLPWPWTGRRPPTGSPDAPERTVTTLAAAPPRSLPDRVPSPGVGGSHRSLEPMTDARVV